ncbi:hypothetical protein, partial [Streptococcus suis]|uniref:hypothetical protein n=1 Tax=Streptococcus suis TaxID=1307 RepID=UPI003CFB1E59
MVTGTTWDNLEHIELKPGQVTFHGSLQLPFALRAYDVELDITLPFNEVQSSLSEFGKAVLETQGLPY